MRLGVFFKIGFAKLDRKSGEYFRIFTKSGIPVKNEALRYILNTLPIGLRGHIFGVSYSECLKRYGSVNDSWFVVLPDCFENQVQDWRKYVHEALHSHVLLEKEVNQNANKKMGDS